MNDSPLFLCPGLGALAPPAADQVLTFDGTGLAWRNSASNGLRMMDAQGNEVGIYSRPDGSTFGNVLRFIPEAGVIMFIGVGHNSVVDYLYSGQFYESVDCTGTPYSPFNAIDDFSFLSEVTGGTLYHPAGPGEAKVFQSNRSPAPDRTSFGPCQLATFKAPLFPVGTLPLFGLTPPFRLSSRLNDERVLT